MLEDKEVTIQQLLGGACRCPHAAQCWCFPAPSGCDTSPFALWKPPAAVPSRCSSLGCASGPWCLSAAGEDISDLTSGQVKFCEIPQKLLCDQAICYKTFFYRTLLLSAVLSSSSCAEEIWYSFMIALLAITRAHCCAFVNIKGELHCREISSAKRISSPKGKWYLFSVLVI